MVREMGRRRRSRAEIGMADPAGGMVGLWWTGWWEQTLCELASRRWRHLLDL